MLISSFFLYISFTSHNYFGTIRVYNNNAENSLNYFVVKFFDLPDPALIIVGRKSIIEGEKLDLSAGKHHYS